MYSARRWRRVRRALPAFAVLLLAAGCLEPGSSGGDGIDSGLDEAMKPVAAAYYGGDGGEGGQRNVERSARQFGGGPTSSEGLQFHTLDEVAAHLEELNATHPRLVDLRVIGTTHQGRPVWDLVITDESVPAAGKLAPLLDGAHHGNEYAGGELMLYVADLLLENHGGNATVRQLLRDLEIHIVPVVNPDGWVAHTRFNGNGVNLNRNYDIDWGNPMGTSNPVMGTVGAAAGQPVGGVGLAAENCGASAFSEPESKAVRNLMASLSDRAAFYFSGHTNTHAVIAPWAAFAQPNALPTQHAAVLESELQWIRDNTEYEAGKAQWGNLSAGLPYAASGSSMDYYYSTVGKPAFTVEVEFGITSATSPDYPGRLLEPFDGLRHWMEVSVGLPMHLLANAAALSRWGDPTAPALAPPAVVPGWLVPAPPRAHL